MSNSMKAACTSSLKLRKMLPNSFKKNSGIKITKRKRESMIFQRIRRIWSSGITKTSPIKAKRKKRQQKRKQTETDEDAKA